MARKTFGLRAQLIGGLALILLVATLTVGAITNWATGRQLDEVQRIHARWVGRAVAVTLAESLSRRAGGAKVLATLGQLRLVLGEAFWSARTVEVFGPRQRLVARSGQVGGSMVFVRRALREGKQVVGIAQGPLLEVATPISRAAEVLGAVRLQLPLAADTARRPLVFWLLMGLDSLLLVFFVALVLTRYVARPVEAMQRAAARVASGDLDVTLDEGQGARELASLASSFNAMTASVKDQLTRIERQQASLAQSAKLASVGRLAAGVAHEIGNPMQSIIGFADLLRDDGLDPAKRADFVGRIHSEAERIHRIIGELLEYSRPGQEDPVATDLAAVVDQAVGLVEHQKRLRGIAITRRGLAELPAARANPGRLVQVLVNLLLNAADAQDGRGEILIEGRLAGEDREPPLQLRVENDGPQISSAEREAVFDPFFTTKDPGQGSGLGLAVSRSIIEALGGQLTLAEQKPTCFVVALRSWPEDAGDENC